MNNKTGHGIWIHGMPLNKDREDYTKGCIALDNDHLKNLDKNLDIEKSIFLITESKPINVKKEHISSVLSFIYKWKDAWRDSNIDEYLSFYSKDFKRYDGMRLERFSRYKKRIFAKNERKTITFKNINIMPYPNSSNKSIYKISMDEDYRTRTYKFEGKKELFVEVIGDKVEILIEG